MIGQHTVYLVFTILNIVAHANTTGTSSYDITINDVYNHYHECMDRLRILTKACHQDKLKQAYDTMEHCEQIRIELDDVKLIADKLLLTVVATYFILSILLMYRLLKWSYQMGIRYFEKGVIAILRTSDRYILIEKRDRTSSQEVPQTILSPRSASSTRSSSPVSSAAFADVEIHAPTQEPSTSYQKEVYKQGSPYQQGQTPPNTQFSVEGWDESTRTYRHFGSGYRLDSWLVMPQHVLTEVSAYDGYVRITRDGKTVESPASEWTEAINNVDVAFTKWNDAKYSKLQLRMNNMTQEIRDHLSVEIYSENLKTQGGLTLSTEHTGRIIYGGSTKNGFSGSPYMWNKKTIGMHQGSSSSGMGLTNQYILAIIKTTLRKISPPYVKESRAGSGFESDTVRVEEYIEAAMQGRGKGRLFATPDGFELDLGDAFIILDEEHQHYDKLVSLYADERNRRKAGSRIPRDDWYNECATTKIPAQQQEGEFITKAQLRDVMHAFKTSMNKAEFPDTETPSPSYQQIEVSKNDQAPPVVEGNGKPQTVEGAPPSPKCHATEHTQISELIQLLKSNMASQQSTLALQNSRWHDMSNSLNKLSQGLRSLQDRVKSSPQPKQQRRGSRTASPSRGTSTRGSQQGTQQQS